MENIGKVIVYIIMISAVCGCIASIIDSKSQLGKQFIKGVETVASIFLPIAGIMSLSPLLSQVITMAIAPLYKLIGADAAMAATTFIAVDMGGYQLAEVLSQTKESWIIAMVTGYMAGATIVFTIPVALKMLNNKDHKYLALGSMAGFLSMPIGILTASLLMLITQPAIRETVLTTGDATYTLCLSLSLIVKNLIPLIIICLLIAIGLYLRPAMIIQGFQKFGAVLNAVLKIVFLLCVIEHFTGLGTTLFRMVNINWPFDKIVADRENINRALESAGYISMMLCGAFPMVFLVKKYCLKYFKALADKFNINETLIAGLVACSANVLALFPLIKEMSPEDKIKALSFAVCCGFLLGDHLAFTANFQPSLTLIVIIGKLVGGISAIMIATYVVIPLTKKEIEKE